MNVERIELLSPIAGDKVWQIEITTDGKAALKCSTSIALAEPTQKVVERLRRQFKARLITAPRGLVIHPKPAGGYPWLNSWQRSTR